MRTRNILLALLAPVMLCACDRPAVVGSDTQAAVNATTTQPFTEDSCMLNKPVKNEADWRNLLSPEQYNILREKGTERAFTGQYWDTHEKGIYHCAACGQPLFSSETKYDSGTGWPSFWEPLTPQSVTTQSDNGLVMTRTEVLCPHCGSHLGHVFNDGPKPTGMRYCMNSAALKLEKE